MRCLAILANTLLEALLLASASATAGEPQLQLPLACKPGTDCWIANHVDLDPGPLAQDYRCGHLTYNGHDGTDFAIRDMAAMREGMAVLAAAAGAIRAVRDGVPDRNVRQAGEDSVKKIECGNGVVIAHEDGWETQYCHLREGSILVKPGQRVTAGEALGKVGLSGLTEFPHLHFIVRKAGKPVDPFLGPEETPRCGATPHPLWKDSPAVSLPYAPGVIYHAGIAPEEPTTQAIREGRYGRPNGTPIAIDRNAGALVFYVEVFGLSEKDRLSLRLTAPDGSTLASREVSMERSQARWIGFVGKHRRADMWPAGSYRAEAILIHANSTAAEPSRRTIDFDVR